MNKKTTAITAGLLVLFVLASRLEFSTEQQTATAECELVNVWMQDKADGVPAIDRNGYPPRSKQQRDFCQEVE